MKGIKTRSIAAAIAFIAGMSIGWQLLYPPVLVATVIGFFTYLTASSLARKDHR